MVIPGLEHIKWAGAGAAEQKEGKELEGEGDSRLEAQMGMLRFILPQFTSIWLGFFKLQT